MGSSIQEKVSVVDVSEVGCLLGEVGRRVINELGGSRGGGVH